MSDTPRTDAVEVIAHTMWRENENWNSSGRYIPADFARQLERELAEANDKAEDYKTALHDHVRNHHGDEEAT